MATPPANGKPAAPSIIHVAAIAPIAFDPVSGTYLIQGRTLRLTEVRIAFPKSVAREIVQAFSGLVSPPPPQPAEKTTRPPRRYGRRPKTPPPDDELRARLRDYHEGRMTVPQIALAWGVCDGRVRQWLGTFDFAAWREAVCAVTRRSALAAAATQRAASA